MPSHIIFELIEYGSLLRREDLHYQEYGTATLTACFVNSNRDLKKYPAAKPEEYFHFRRLTKESKMSGYVPQLLFTRTTAGTCHPWILSYIPLDAIREAKKPYLPIKSFDIEYLDIPNKLLLIGCTIERGWLKAEFALLKEVQGIYPINYKGLSIYIPGEFCFQHESRVLWSIDQYFKVIKV